MLGSASIGLSERVRANYAVYIIFPRSEKKCVINRRDTLKLLGGAGAYACLKGRTFGQMQAAVNAPSFIVVMTDDQRHDALSIAGNKILKTPNMDRIGLEGVWFRNAFVTNALCAPSRATLLTGVYSYVHGVISNGDGPDLHNQPGIPDDQRTFVEVLHRAGYYTGIVGKWHLRSIPTGFDHWVILPGQGNYYDPEMIANGARVRMRGHVDDVVGDQALTFMQDRPKNKPFCLLCNFKSPHRSWEPAARFADRFKDVEIPVPRTFEDKLEGRPEALRKAEMAIADMPDFRDRGVPESLPSQERKRRNLQALVKNYYRVLLSVDENVGRVLDFMDKNVLTGRRRSDLGHSTASIPRRVAFSSKAAPESCMEAVERAGGENFETWEKGNGLNNGTQPVGTA